MNEKRAHLVRGIVDLSYEIFHNLHRVTYHLKGAINIPFPATDGDRGCCCVRGTDGLESGRSMLGILKG